MKKKKKNSLGTHDFVSRTELVVVVMQCVQCTCITRKKNRVCQWSQKFLHNAYIMSVNMAPI